MPDVADSASTPDFSAAAAGSRTASTSAAAPIAPGALVEVRDETWLVEDVAHTGDGPLYTVRGVSDFVRDTTATFYGSDGLDEVTVHRPENTRVVADGSSHYRAARLWLEATLRKTAVPADHDGLTVSTQMLADDLPYQREAVLKALEPDRVRPRLLIADAVGLGKTLEIGMILAELIRRGRGRRILIVTPRHVLEQMQHELWTRFAIPVVRLDSEGVQQVKQKLPADRNPFTFFEKVIISIDTLKQDRFVHDLRSHRWDAVVIDESHNVTNQSTQNNKLAHTLGPNTDALILASATPHNGRNESFAQLITLLDPTAVGPDGQIAHGATQQLMVRRHRYSPSVKDVVGDRWAERKDPILLPVAPTEEELAVAQEIARTWTHPQGAPPVTGGASRLVPWSFAKGFLSSPPALHESLRARARTLTSRCGIDASGADALEALVEIPETADAAVEARALRRLAELNAATMPEGTRPRSGKYAQLVQLLKDKGVAKDSPVRVVVFAERVATLHWLQEHLKRDLKLTKGQVEILHGGLSDIEQQEVVEGFKRASAPVRVLVTGDVASEGVNLHAQSHELIHYDIPWSLIRIEQRNGRIDRYGQRVSPQITALLLDLQGVDGFSGDMHVLRRLLDREKEAHEQLGDAASLMQKYSAAQEEDELVAVLRGQKDFDAVVHDPQALVASAAAGSKFGNDFLAAMLAQQQEEHGHTLSRRKRRREESEAAKQRTFHTDLFGSDADFLTSTLTQLYREPARPVAHGGVGLEVVDSYGLISFIPDDDLRRRMLVLPQSYLRERDVLSRVQLTSHKELATQHLQRALASDDTTWPEVHFLGPLHPVLGWAADKVLAAAPRSAVYAVHGRVDRPWVLFQGVLTTRRGQTVSTQLLGVAEAADGSLGIVPDTNPAVLFAEIGLSPRSIGVAVEEPEQYQELLRRAVAVAREHMTSVVSPQVIDAATTRLAALRERQDSWLREAEQSRSHTALLTVATKAVHTDQQLLQVMQPDATFVRPLLVVVPEHSAGAQEL